MVNWEFFDNQTPSSARDLVDGLREGQPPIADPRCAVVHIQGDRESPCRPARSRSGRRADTRPVTPPSPDCGSPRSAAWRRRGRTAVTDSHGAPDDEKVATEATKDEPAPGPSATVPAEPNEPETDPDATDSKT